MTPVLETSRLVPRPLALEDADRIQVAVPDGRRPHLTDYWFDVLSFPLMRIPKAAANAASRRISEKQRMRLVAAEERDYVEGRLPAEIWEITAGERRARRARRG